MAKRHIVRVGSHYQFHAVGVDIWSPVHQGLQEGQEVVVVNLPGAPRANVMGHCYVNDLDGLFGGMVLTNSLLSKADYKAMQAEPEPEPRAGYSGSIVDVIARKV